MRFRDYHPAIHLIYFAGAIAGTILFDHPVLVVISWAAAFACSVLFAGKKAFVFDLILLPLAGLWTLWYASFHHFGVTALGTNSVGNSGVYIHGKYEMQIFNSANKEKPDQLDCGALYNKYAPLVQACKPAGEWQVYDIKYTAPRRDESGKIVEPGRITAYLNGQLVQNDVTFEEPWSVYRPEIRQKSACMDEVNKVMKETGEGPLFLQDHSAPVKFRNVWIKKVQ